MPRLSPRAFAYACPSAMPTSSMVWWASTSRSPFAFTRRSQSECFASSVNIWSKNGTPVETLDRPLPSMARVSVTWVSVVLRMIRPVRVFIWSGVRWLDSVLSSRGSTRRHDDNNQKSVDEGGVKPPNSRAGLSAPDYPFLHPFQWKSEETHSHRATRNTGLESDRPAKI